jgi:hypothetical protein
MKKHTLFSLPLLTSLFLASCQGFSVASLASSSASSASSKASSSSSVASASSSLSSVAPSSESSSVSIKQKTIKTTAVFDGVNNKELEETFCYQQPVWGMKMPEKFPLSSLDSAKPTLEYDSDGNSAFKMEVDYNEAYTWHCTNAFSHLGNTVVPSAYLQNIILDTSSEASFRVKRDAITAPVINWNANATIKSNNGIVAVNQVVDMSTQIDSITLSDGTVFTDWTLAPNNTAYASASLKTFTPLKASNKTVIKIMNGTTQISSFSVRVVSEELNTMAVYLQEHPYGKNYDARLIKEADSSVVASANHRSNYFYTDNALSGVKKGVLDTGSGDNIGFEIIDGKVVADNYRA